MNLWARLSSLPFGGRGDWRVAFTAISTGTEAGRYREEKATADGSYVVILMICFYFIGPGRLV
jgi:hypothetical protein